MRNKKEIEEQMEKASDQIIKSSGFSDCPAMSFEEGVRDALGWALGHYDEKPMGEE